ncbi:hypothetical protein MPSEU_000746800 [Mayamaea pseudoterrestris]|nr:hypothetical protein MPSEU_000746800 [Mayamaea pseudoterrestris]
MLEENPCIENDRVSSSANDEKCAKSSSMNDENKIDNRSSVASDIEPPVSVCSSNNIKSSRFAATAHSHALGSDSVLQSADVIARATAARHGTDGPSELFGAKSARAPKTNLDHEILDEIFSNQSLLKMSPGDNSNLFAAAPSLVAPQSLAQKLEMTSTSESEFGDASSAMDAVFEDEESGSEADEKNDDLLAYPIASDELKTQEEQLPAKRSRTRTDRFILTHVTTKRRRQSMPKRLQDDDDEEEFGLDGNADAYGAGADVDEVGMEEGTGSEDVQKGSIVFAKWTRKGDQADGCYFWGKVIAKKANRNSFTVSILFDDGDTLDNVPPKNFYTADFMVASGDKAELEYIGALPGLIEKGLWNKRGTKSVVGPADFKTGLVTMRNQCCGNCSNCMKRECGNCQGCKMKGNVKVCLLKPCSQMKPPWIPLHLAKWKDWSFKVVIRTKKDNEDVVHPDLASVSIRFGGPGGRVYKWASVPAFAKRRDGASHKAKFVKAMFGLKITSTGAANHPFLGRGFRREWLDMEGRLQCIEGTITNVTKTQFIIRYDDAYVQSHNSANGGQFSVSAVQRLEHMCTWSGVAAYAQHHSLELPAVKTDDCALTLGVPGSVRNYMDASGLPCRELFYRGWKLKFEVKRSKIDHKEANLGCFVTCESCSPATKNLKYMTLAASEFIDIGVYGRPEDCIPESLGKLKDFIHKGKPGRYAFDVPAIGKQRRVLDVSDDLTGDLNEAARRNILPYVNETDGIEIECIMALTDPANQIHYHLGHQFVEFKIEPGKQYEVKNDYRAGYEKNRIKNNYPRVTGKQLDVFKREIEEEDSDYIESCVNATPDVLAAHAAFLKNFAKQVKRRVHVVQHEAHQRALLVAIILLHEINAQDDNVAVMGANREAAAIDVATMKANILAAVRILVNMLAPSLLHNMLADPFYLEPIIKSLGLATVGDFDAWYDTMCL